MTLEDICAGTPKAFVKDERGDEHEVLNMTPHRFGPATFGYACEIAGGYELYAMPEDIRVGFC